MGNLLPVHRKEGWYPTLGRALSAATNGLWIGNRSVKTHDPHSTLYAAYPNPPLLKRRGFILHISLLDKVFMVTRKLDFVV
jgi:hypothetical protein